MKKTIIRCTSMLALVGALLSCQACTSLQRALGCSDPGIFGCRDEMQPPVDREKALEQAPSVATGRFPPRPQDQRDQPWVVLIQSCMAAGGQRTQCIENLPPEVFAQLEAWEAENADMRRRQLEQRARERLQPVSEESRGKKLDTLAEVDLLQFLFPRYAKACILTVNERLLSADSS